jgi:hypothetical protein
MVGMAEDHPDEEPIYRLQVMMRRVSYLLADNDLVRIVNHLDGDERKGSLVAVNP